jgi:hypothetical protein
MALRLPQRRRDKTSQVALPHVGQTLVGLLALLYQDRMWPSFSIHPWPAWLPGLTRIWGFMTGLRRTQNNPIALLGCRVHKNPNSEDLPYWPMLNQDEQYL